MNKETIGSTIYIKDFSVTRVTREADPYDRWSGEDTETSHDVQGISLRKFYNCYECLDLDYTPVAGEDYYLMWAIYSTGDSFSHDKGRIVFIDLFKNEQDALEIKKILDKVNDFSVKIKSANGKVYTFSVPWHGYFESLTGIEVQKFKLEA